MKLLSFSELKTVKGIPYSKSQIYRLIRAGKFPAPIRLGPNRVSFIEEQTDAWIEAKVEGRDFFQPENILATLRPAAKTQSAAPTDIGSGTKGTSNMKDIASACAAGNLEHQRDRELIRRWQDHQDVAARNELVKHYRPLAGNQARRRRRPQTNMHRGHHPRRRYVRPQQGNDLRYSCSLADHGQTEGVFPEEPQRGYA
jgi:prophage regulatory protein